MLTNFSSIANTALQAGILKQVNKNKIGVQTVAKDVFDFNAEMEQKYKRIKQQQMIIKTDRLIDKAIYGDKPEGSPMHTRGQKLQDRQNFMNSPAGKQFAKDNQINDTYMTYLQRRIAINSYNREIVPQRIQELRNGANKNEK